MEPMDDTWPAGAAPPVRAEHPAGEGSDVTAIPGAETGGHAPGHAAKDTGLAEVLLLVGAVLAVVGALAYGLFWGAFWPWMGSWFDGTAMDPVWRGFATFGMVAAGVAMFFGLVLGVLAVVAYAKVRNGDLDAGAVLGLVAGALLLLTGSLLSGALVLVGGALAWQAKEG